jgi:hypothetical protein
MFMSYMPGSFACLAGRPEKRQILREFGSDLRKSRTRSIHDDLDTKKRLDTHFVDPLILTQKRNSSTS